MPEKIVRHVLVVSPRPMFHRTFGKLVELSGGDLRVATVASTHLGRGAVGPEEGADLMLIDAGSADPVEVERLVVEARRAHPLARLGIVLDEQDDAVVDTAMAAGAAGVLIKAAPPTVLVESLRLILGGESCRPDPAFELRAEDLTETMRARLGAREQKLVRLLLGGESISSVARKLHLTRARVVLEMRRVMDVVKGRDDR